MTIFLRICGRISWAFILSLLVCAFFCFHSFAIFLFMLIFIWTRLQIAEKQFLIRIQSNITTSCNALFVTFNDVDFRALYILRTLQTTLGLISSLSEIYITHLDIVTKHYTYQMKGLRKCSSDWCQTPLAHRPLFWYRHNNRHSKNLMEYILEFITPIETNF